MDKRVISQVVVVIIMIFLLIILAVDTFEEDVPTIEEVTTAEAEAVRVIEDLPEESVDALMKTDDETETETELEADTEPPLEEVSETTEEIVTQDVVLAQDSAEVWSPLPEDCEIALRETCESSGVPYELALGLIYVESRFMPDVVSQSGCYGYCQLHPQYFPAWLSPADNIRYGIGWLGELITEYRDIGAALTAYSAGHDTGDRWYADLVIAAARDWGYEG